MSDENLSPKEIRKSLHKMLRDLQFKPQKLQTVNAWVQEKTFIEVIELGTDGFVFSVADRNQGFFAIPSPSVGLMLNRLINAGAWISEKVLEEYGNEALVKLHKDKSGK